MKMTCIQIYMCRYYMYASIDHAGIVNACTLRRTSSGAAGSEGETRPSNITALFECIRIAPERRLKQYEPSFLTKKGGVSRRRALGVRAGRLRRAEIAIQGLACKPTEPRNLGNRVWYKQQLFSK